MGLDTVYLVKRIEDHFGIRIPNAEAERIVTVQDLHDAVSRHLSPATNEADQMIHDDVYSIIADHSGFEVFELKPHLRIVDDLGLD